MSIVDKVDRFQRRHRSVGFPLAVIYKFFDDQGPYLAALLTYYGFLSAFPLLLLLSSILGFVLQGHPTIEHRIMESALSQFPVIGTQLTTQSLHGDGKAIAIGLTIALYGALGVGQALQNALNVCWAVPRNRRPNPFVSRGRSLLLIVTAGLFLLVTTVLSGIASSASAYGLDLGAGGGWALTALTVLLNAGIFLLIFRIATAHPMRWRRSIPGALLSAVWWQVLQSIGTAYVSFVVKGSTDAYGVFALVLGLLGWGFLASCGVVMAIELNVVLAKHLYPRALLTVFTDNVDLTDADKKYYEGLVNANRLKGFQQVDVSFERSLEDLEAETRPVPRCRPR
ncbi:YihY/virulence factor BrkB family protein [Arsenicicoccus dermatophilus]|uniref:YihY/virulence factor BrkB family protein n=1 Tax=Arsenicicoccus dermatophilus TaxID=1076331 RepID=UPI001F4CB0B3|nr:YihY/virulence factor BrkB family protein [Arsenicicoccus dermatophilus]